MAKHIERVDFYNYPEPHIVLHRGMTHRTYYPHHNRLHHIAHLLRGRVYRQHGHVAPFFNGWAWNV